MMMGLAIALLATAASAAFPGVQPQLAAMDGRVYLAFGAGNSISVARSDDGGETFRAPVALPLSGRLSLGMRRGPRVAVTRTTVLVTAVAGAKGGGADGDVLVFRSVDRGQSWEKPVVLNDVPGAAREGLHAMTATPSGLVVVAWLDLRDKTTRVYAAVSRDHGTTWTPDALVYASPGGSVCECCHPSVAVDDAGRIAVMFRNNLDGNRDMYVAQSDDGRTFAGAVKLGTGSWALNGCPMDGGSLAFGDGVTAIWRREDVVFLSTRDQPERRLGAGRDPVVATSGSRRDLAWASPAGIVLVRDAAPAMAIAPGRFPAILALADRTILAWEDKGSLTVRAIPR
jgi:hypothetical protein